MKRLAITLVHHSKNQVWYIIFFISVFTLLGYYLPKIYLDYIDKTEYLRFDSPISTDKKTYKPCEKIILLATRYSLVATKVTNVMTIVKDNEDGSYVKKPGPVLHYTIDRAPAGKLISAEFKLPCDLSAGTYFYEGVNTYKVKGSEKTQYYTSSQFNIINETDTTN